MNNEGSLEIDRPTKEEYEGMVEDATKTLRRRMEENGGEFSETIGIQTDGMLELVDKAGELKSFFAHTAVMGGDVNNGAEELYRLAYKVQEKAPEINFSFQRDPQGKSITYIASESTATNPASA